MDDVPAAAAEANARAGDRIEARRFDEAIALAEEAARLAPGWQDAWWNLAVACKHARQWRACLDACERALAIAPDVALHWNAGIAATALDAWTRAREAWRACGIAVPGGDGPFALAPHRTPIRLRSGEIVWTERIDPCRARIVSVPAPGSDRGYADVVLHDGEPTGEVDQELVFDELDLLARSPYGTWDVALDLAPAEVDALLARFAGDVTLEDWSVDPSGRDRRLGIAARNERDLRPLRDGTRWRAGVRAVEMVRPPLVERALSDDV